MFYGIRPLFLCIGCLLYTSQIGNQQGLGVNITIHGAEEYFPEVANVNIRRIQDGFIEVLPATAIVIVLGQNGYLGPDVHGTQQDRYQAQGT